MTSCRDRREIKLWTGDKVVASCRDRREIKLWTSCRRDEFMNERRVVERVTKSKKSKKKEEELNLFTFTLYWTKQSYLLALTMFIYFYTRSLLSLLYHRYPLARLLNLRYPSLSSLPFFSLPTVSLVPSLFYNSPQLYLPTVSLVPQSFLRALSSGSK